MLLSCIQPIAELACSWDASCIAFGLFGRLYAIASPTFLLSISCGAQHRMHKACDSTVTCRCL